MAKLLGKWWTGLRCRCNTCGERFELEEDDRPYSTSAFDWAIECPSCYQVVKVHKPYGV